MDIMEALIAQKLIGGGGGGGGSGMSDDVKQAFLEAFNHVAWTDEHGQDYIDALEAAMYQLSYITSVYTQSGPVYGSDSLDSLRADLVVTAFYQGCDSKTVTDYTLSGTLTEGVSTITVSYHGKTATFDVTVSAGKSDMNGWTDGVAYTDLTIIEDQYYQASDGAIKNYTGWNRTGYVPCNGASSITFAAMPQTSGGAGGQSNAFFKEDKTWIQGITISKTEETIVSVPENAYYFGISSEAAALATCIENGIVPHE